MCWIDVYLGPPDVVTHEAGKQIMARVLQVSAEMMNIQTKAVPIKTVNSMSLVERYHGPLRRAYKLIQSESPDLCDKEVLQIAVRSINDAIGTDGLVPTLLVYGTLPRLGFSTDKPTPSMQKRSTALRKAKQEMSKHFARCQISAATRTRNGPNTSDI